MRKARRKIRRAPKQLPDSEAAKRLVVGGYKARARAGGGRISLAVMSFTGLLGGIVFTVEPHHLIGFAQVIAPRGIPIVGLIELTIARAISVIMWCLVA